VRILAAALLSLASILGVVGWFRPQIIRPVYVSWMVAVFPIGWMISHVVLAVVFFGVFTLLGLLVRIGGRDALGLKWQCKKASYWTRKEAYIAKHRYLQQF
jgi:hypothetical protein